MIYVIALAMVACLIGPVFGRWVEGMDNPHCQKKWDCNVDNLTYVHTLCYTQTPYGQFQAQADQTKTEVRLVKEEDKKTVLRLHNELRNEQNSDKYELPPAANMRQLTWDNELEAVAKALAVFLSPFPDKCRSTAAFPNNNVGQNYEYADSWDSSAKHPPSIPLPIIVRPTMAKKVWRNWGKTFALWIGNTRVETLARLISKFSYAGSEIPPQVLKRFVSLLWATTHKIGCAEVVFTGHDKDMPGYIFVCNYGPRGAVEGEPVFRIGHPCSGCPAGTSCKEDSIYPNLCAGKNDPVNDDLGN